MFYRLNISFNIYIYIMYVIYSFISMFIFSLTKFKELKLKKYLKIIRVCLINVSSNLK